MFVFVLWLGVYFFVVSVKMNLPTLRYIGYLFLLARHVESFSVATSKVSAEVPSIPPTSNDNKKVGNVVFLLPHNCKQIQSKFGERSPYGSPNILEATYQLQRKVGWFSDQLVDAEILILPENSNSFRKRP